MRVGISRGRVSSDCKEDSRKEIGVVATYWPGLLEYLLYIYISYGGLKSLVPLYPWKNPYYNPVKKLDFSFSSAHILIYHILILIHTFIYEMRYTYQYISVLWKAQFHNILLYNKHPQFKSNIFKI